MVWVSIIIMIMALAIGLFSVAGLHVGIMRKRFFALFPPAHFLSNALKGVEKLQSLDEKAVDEKGNEIEGMKAAVVRRGDKGFKELMKIIIDNNRVEGEFEDIVLWEGEAGVFIGNISPKVVRFLVLRQGEKEEVIRTDPFDPSKPIRDLRNWIEDDFRKQMAYWMMGMLGVWLVANSYMLYLLNR